MSEGPGTPNDEAEQSDASDERVGSAPQGGGVPSGWIRDLSPSPDDAATDGARDVDGAVVLITIQRTPCHRFGSELPQRCRYVPT